MEPEIRTFASRAEWRAWLDAHHASNAGFWLKLAKKGNPASTLTYAEALDVALCYGWIDGQKKGFDDEWWLQRFTPRGKRSIWSQINREKVAALIASGEMRPAGLAEVDRAKADGRWEAAYAPQSRAEVPDDLRAALDADPEAKAFFASLNGANRYAILHRVLTAKKPETRAARIERLVAMCHRGEKIHP